MRKPVMVTGLGCVCAAGASLDDAVAAMYAGKRFPAAPEAISAELDKIYPVFEIKQPLRIPEKYITCNYVSRTVRLALMALDEALKTAALDNGIPTDLKVGVCIGTTVGCTLNNEPFYRDYLAGVEPSVKAIDAYLDNNPSRYISKILGADSMCASVVNACASGSDAIGTAMAWIREGLCDIVIAGGADELSRITYLGFISLMISSTEACLPFDLNRSGLNLGEGAGILILESEEAAEKRGCRIIARACGYGNASDAYHPTRPHPEGRGLRSAVNKALEDAGIKPADISFINAHGTATPDNDRTEGKVISEIFGKGKVVSTKAFTGHTLGAAGALEAAFTIRSMNDGKIPPTAGFSAQDPECFIEPTRELTEVEGDYALSTSLAFGGGNAALVFGRAD